jgi:GNAT superfamily N-acetyltransferase
VSTVITAVESRAELMRFIRFPYRLYRDNACWVPPLIADELETLSPNRNPAFEQAEARLFLATRGGVVVGRVAGILSRAANEKYGTRNVRFGWFDCVHSAAVAAALLEAVAAWGRERGMTTMTGPHGFTDLDQEGMLVEGFQERATIATIYNHPYYPALVERCGFRKDVDYVEFLARVPADAAVPERMAALARRSAERNHLRLVQCSSARQIRVRYGAELFDLLDESFAELYGTVPLTRAQKEWYIRKYLPFTRPDLVKIVCAEDGRMVGFMIALPSLSGAFQKAGGRLLPFGFLHLLAALRSYESIDFMLAGVAPTHRGKGIDRLMTVDMFRTAISRGVRRAESNPELEDNLRIQNQWKVADSRRHKRRRIYRKVIA